MGRYIAKVYSCSAQWVDILSRYSVYREFKFTLTYWLDIFAEIFADILYITKLTTNTPKVISIKLR